MLKQHAFCLFFLISTVAFSATYPASVVCVLLSSHLFYYCQWDLEVLSKCSRDIFMMLKKKLKCIIVSLCLQTDTIVFALHKALPLSEPLHADAQDYCRSLLRLELFVQLQARQQAHSILIHHKALRHHSCRLHMPTLMKVSISIFLRLARASISTWQVAHI